MSCLAKPTWERFAACYAHTGNAAESYRQCGAKGKQGPGAGKRGAEYRNKPEIARRIQELRGEIAAAAVEERIPPERLGAMSEQPPALDASAQAEQAMAALTTERKAKLYSARRIEQEQPALYRLAWRLLGDGMSPTRIANRSGMDIRTVLAIRARADEQGLLPPFRAAQIQRLEDLIILGSEVLIDRFQEGKATALDIKLLGDYRELLSGNATVIVRHTEDPEIAALRAEHMAQLARRFAENCQPHLVDSPECLPDARPGRR